MLFFYNFTETGTVVFLYEDFSVAETASYYFCTTPEGHQHI